MPRIGTRFEPFIGLTSSSNSLSKGKVLSAARLIGMAPRAVRQTTAKHRNKQKTSRREPGIAHSNTAIGQRS